MKGISIFSSFFTFLTLAVSLFSAFLSIYTQINIEAQTRISEIHIFRYKELLKLSYDFFELKYKYNLEKELYSEKDFEKLIIACKKLNEQLAILSESNNEAILKQFNIIFSACQSMVAYTNPNYQRKELFLERELYESCMENFLLKYNDFLNTELNEIKEITKSQTILSFDSFHIN